MASNISWFVASSHLIPEGQPPDALFQDGFFTPLAIAVLSVFLNLAGSVPDVLYKLLSTLHEAHKAKECDAWLEGRKVEPFWLQVCAKGYKDQVCLDVLATH